MNDGTSAEGLAVDHVPDEAKSAELLDVLGHVWHHIVLHVNKLLETHRKFGFFQFKENLNPSLEDILQGLEFIDFALSKLLDSKQLEYEETRIVLNSKQVILMTKQLSAACDNGNEVDYERIIGDLKKQAPI